MKNIFSSLILLLSICFLAKAQQTGTVDFPEYGVKFTIPDQWMGRATNEAFLMASNTQPGFMMVVSHEAGSMQEMRATALQGIVDPASSIYLQLSGELKNYGDTGLKGLFSGNMGGQPAHAYVIGLLNELGAGITIMSCVSQELWNEEYVKLAHSLAKSTEFYAPEKPVSPRVTANGGNVEEWKNRLGNTRLTYLESYNSIDYSNPGYTSGGGYSNKEVIDLCSKGYFDYSSSNFMSVSGGSGVNGNSYGQGAGAGRWEIRTASHGNKILVLSFYSGEVFEYTLSYPERKMHLNGKRYYHTWTGENAPNCY